MKLHYLGPEGSFSHEVALFKQAEDPSISLHKSGSWTEIARNVHSNSGDLGLLVNYNLIDDHPQQALDVLHRFRLSIIETLRLPIVWYAGKSKYCCGDIETIYSHEKGLGQTQSWITTSFPIAEQVPVASTSRAAELVSEQKSGLAISSLDALNSYGLDVIASDIGDRLPAGQNYTDFYLVSSEIHESERIEGNDYSTRFVVRPRQNLAGTLAKIAVPLAENNVDLVDFRSRKNPYSISNKNSPSLIFFGEASAHYQDAHFVDACAQIRTQVGDVYISGSPQVKVIRK